MKKQVSNLLFTAIIITLSSFSNPSVNNYFYKIDNNEISELLQKVITEHKLSTIKTTERRGDGYVVTTHVLFSFEENNMLIVDQGGYNLNHMYRYDIVLEPIRKRDSPYLELYF